MAFIVIGVALLIILELIMDKKQWDEYIRAKPPAIRWLSYQTMALLVILIGNIDGKAFIYFQF